MFSDKATRKGSLESVSQVLRLACAISITHDFEGSIN
jgi:hypothetical protein